MGVRLAAHQLDRLGQHRLRHSHRVELADLAVRELERAPCHSVRLDVVGMAVEAVVVVADHDLRPDLPDDGEQLSGGLIHIGLQKQSGASLVGSPIMPDRATGPGRRGTGGRSRPVPRRPPASSPILYSPSPPPASAARWASSGGMNLAELAQGAGDQRDPAPSAAYFAIVAPVPIGLVIGMGVHEQSLRPSSVALIPASLTAASAGRI